MKQSIFQLWKIPFTFLTTGILGFSHRVPILVTVLPLQMAKSSVVWNPVIYVLMNKQVFSKDIFWICVKWIDQITDCLDGFQSASIIISGKCNLDRIDQFLCFCWITDDLASHSINNKSKILEKNWMINFHYFAFVFFNM